MNNLVTAYCIYLPVMLALTIWVARTIHKNTRSFLLEIFPAHENVASAVNNLLQTGFYLISLGFGFIRLRAATGTHIEKTREYLVTNKELFEILAMKLGGFTLFIGALLFFNLFLMLILRKSSIQMRIHDAQLKNYWEARKQAGV
jgi:hypothetical protein